MTPLGRASGPVYDRSGSEIETFEQLLELQGDPDYFILAQSWIDDRDVPVKVSTVWLGISQMLDYKYETAVFESHGSIIEKSYTYNDEHAAYAGHWWTVFTWCGDRSDADPDPDPMELVWMLHNAVLLGDCEQRGVTTREH